ncbi:methanol dehydrogenase [Sphingomonas panacisoli]|uniref:Methanol dehydrogenase n=1 Tax=Sphingomonas panacisoli TaxID=1813879 RepID=A0A5B8LDN4_9SPHN|nr:TPM domain-containing protein [Sphingomonas panacisoli]QDZ06217.1 methanol dehydrogenase [Sphingomonas panacisoli]
MRLIRLLVLVLAALVAATPALAQTYPPFSGFVVDAANVLDPATKADLTAKLDALQRDTHRQLIVATIPDMQGYTLEDYGVGLIRAWGVGLKDVNNGIILFIAPNEQPGHRGPRIEVGYGLEPIVTDALAGQIIDEKMMPLLKAGQVPQAMTAGADALIEQLRATPDEAKARTDAAIAAFDKRKRSSSSSGSGDFPIGLVIWALIIGFVILSSLRNGRRGQRYRRGGAPVILWGPGLSDWGSNGSSWGGGSGWSSGGGSSWSDSGGSSWGGGFSGGGGGGGGGGGASGGW